MQRWRPWIARRGPAIRFFCDSRLKSAERSSQNLREQPVDVFKSLGLFRDRGEHTLRAGRVLSILEDRNWQVRLAEEFIKQQEAPNAKLVAEVVSRNCSANCALDFFQWAGRRDSLLLSLEGYNILLTRLFNAKLLDEAEYVFGHMSSAGFPPDLETNCIFLRGLVQADQSVKACSQLDRMLLQGMVPSTELYNTIFHGLCRTGNFTEAIRYWKELPQECRPDAGTYNAMVDVYCRAGDYDRAMLMVEEMQRCGHPSTASYSIIIENLGKIRKGTEALEVFHLMEKRGCWPDVLLVTHLIEGLCKSRMIDEARSIFASMGKYLCVPNLESCNALMAGLCYAQRFTEGIALLDEMKNLGVEGNIVTYSLLIDGLAAVKRLQDAYDVFKRMAQQSCSCTVGAYTNLFDGLQRANKLDEAFEVYRDMEKHGVVLDEKAYNAIIHGLCKMETEGREALKLFNQMLEKSFIPNMVMFGLLLHKLCKDSAVIEAVRLFRAMTSKNYFEADVVCYSTLIQGSCKARMTNLAQELFQEMPVMKVAPNVLTYCALVQGLCFDSQLISTAVQLTYEMLNKGMTPKIFTLNTLLYRLVRFGRMDDALKLYNTVTDEGLVSDGETFGLLVFPRCVARSDGEGERMFRATLAKGLVPTTSSCNILLDRVIKEGRLQVAQEIFSRIKSKCQPNVTTFNIMVQALCESNELDKAYALIGEMQKHGVEANAITYNSMLSNFFHARDPQSAQTLFQDMIAMKMPNATSYNIMVTGLASMKLLNEACKMFQAMLDKRHVPRLDTSNRLLAALCQARMVDKAIHLYKELMATNGVEDVSCYNTLLDGIVKSRDADRAVKFMKEMVDSGVAPTNTSYASLIEAFCNQRRVDEAHRLLIALTEQGEAPRAQAFRYVLEALCVEGRFEEAYDFYCWIPQAGGKVTLSTHNVIVEKLYQGNKLDLLDRLMERDNIPDVIHRRVEIFREHKLGNLEVQRFERARTNKEMSRQRFLMSQVPFCKR